MPHEPRIYRETATFAKQLRKAMTPAEWQLWTTLCAKQCSDYKFRRQVPIGRYVGDFVCFSARIVIEIDGESHDQTEAYDLKRTQWFESQGYEVLRFQNHDVTNNIEGVWQVIAETCIRRKAVD